LLLEKGGTVLEGNSEELMDNPDLKSAYFAI
jgi:ABC-type branched-subunit amino acid transport system ATPase component